MTALKDQIAQLESAILAQEALRPTLGDAAVNAIIAMLRDKLDALRKQEAAGAPVVPASSEALLTGLIPRELAAKMRATGRIEGERKQVTVMFADLSGFTALSERLDPEEVTTLTHEALKSMAEAVYQYEGYIDKFIGDAVMAVFGAPLAHEDDPERALHAALAMREALATFNRRWIERLGQPLALHIGINTGTVIAGNVGSDLRLSYTVMGDTVNIAARREDASQTGQILVSRDTYRLTQEAFTFAALEPITVKGKREALPVFELQRAKLLPGKARGLKGLGSAFVGRERELEQLRAVVSELEAGYGRIVSVNGEAGIGKSRLLAEWRRETGERVRWAEGRAFSHTTSLAYGLFLDMFRRYARIRDEDGEAEARAKLDGAVAQLLPDNAEAHAIFANLLAMRLVPDDTALLATLPAEVLRQRLIGLMRDLFERLARERPTVVIFEDIHWADYASLELIESLLPLTEHMPLALVGVRRLHPDERPSQLRKTVEAHYAHRFSDVSLTHLSDTSSLSLVEQLLSTSAIPEALRAIILRKAEGNPFFVEEVIRSLIERGALMRSEAGWAATPVMETITVPDTVQGVLMARLDALPDETKWLVQQASVIGRIFLYRVLRHIVENTAGVDGDLSRLEREELIRERVRLPEVEYIFKHALTQEVAYQSLLTPRRKELHRKVGEALEAIFAQRLGEFQSIIGEHYLKGEAWDKAADYLIQAGDANAHLYANAEARVHYANGLEALSQRPDDEDNRRRRVDTLVKQAGVSIVADDPAWNLTRLAEAEAMAKDLPGPDGAHPDHLRLARVYYWLGRSSMNRGQQREAIGYAQQVLALAQGSGDADLLAIPSAVIGRALLIQGHFDKAGVLLAQAIGPLEKVANWPEWIITVSYAGVSLAACGQYAAGVAEGQRALTRALETKNVTLIAGCYCYLALVHFFGGDMARYLESARAGVEAGEQSGAQIYVYAGLHACAWAESRLGRHEAARASVMKAREVAQSLGGRLIMADWMGAGDAEMALNAGRVAEAVPLAEQAVVIAQSVGGILAEGWARRTWGQALARLEPPQWDEAESHLTESLRLLEAGDARLEAARTHVAWGIGCRVRGNAIAAREHLEKAAAQFAASELTQELDQARALIAGLRSHSIGLCEED